MPLSDPAPRSPLHKREIICTGYRRADGLWDIEGHLVDTRSYTYRTDWRGEVRPGMPGHEMWLRWTIDQDMVIRAIEVVTDAAPYPPTCPQAAAPYQRLVGAKVGKGFIKEVRSRIARTDGCTHLFTLLEAAANATMQTMAGERWQTPDGAEKIPDLFGTKSGNPLLLNSCHSYAEGSQIVKVIWPEHYKAKE